MLPKSAHADISTARLLLNYAVAMQNNFYIGLGYLMHLDSCQEQKRFEVQPKCR